MKDFMTASTTTLLTAGSRKAVACTKNGTTKEDLVDGVTTSAGQAMMGTAVAMQGTATATATARFTTVDTASGHGTPRIMSSTVGGDPEIEETGEALSGCD